MHLTGARHNREALETLVRLDGLRARLVAMPESDSAPRAAIRPRSGDIAAMVVEVLRDIDAPMQAIDVYREVQRRMDVRVSKDTVFSCLSTGCRGETPPFRRVGVGRYERV